MNDRPSNDAHCGLDFAAQRLWMVENQLRRRGIRDSRVLAAMAAVPRHEFVPSEHRAAAYDDTPLPIGFGQTISQPFTVAFMIEALELTADERVLEIGAGSGYSAAVLAHLAREVYTIERIAALARRAEDTLRRLGYDNVRVRAGDGTLGWPEAAPFDAIIATAGGRALPPAYPEQLTEGGRIVIPLGRHPTYQRMKRFTKREGRLEEEDLGAFAFVPLIGRDGWGEEEV